MIDIKVARSTLDSPLRYPGGKSSLVPFLTSCVQAMKSDSVTYVEPYAGGAGAGVALLLRGVVSRVVINDLDPAVHSFWRAVLEEGERFAEWIRRVPLDLSEWDRQRARYKLGIQDDWFSLGQAFFYLNRTNRSGIINAGVIGGKKQQAKDKIDARFPAEALATRVEVLAGMRSQIELCGVDGRRLIEDRVTNKDTFFYVDPPYVKMGGSLYLNSFNEMDHTLLASCLERHRAEWWFLTYDDHELVRRLYADLTLGEYTLNWSAHNQGKASELYVLSDALERAI